MILFDLIQPPTITRNMKSLTQHAFFLYSPYIEEYMVIIVAKTRIVSHIIVVLLEHVVEVFKIKKARRRRRSRSTNDIRRLRLINICVHYHNHSQ